MPGGRLREAVHIRTASGRSPVGRRPCSRADVRVQTHPEAAASPPGAPGDPRRARGDRPAARRRGRRNRRRRAGRRSAGVLPATRRSTARGCGSGTSTSSEGGSIPAIVARAKRAGIGTVYIKAGDGGSVWSQFSTALVAGAPPRRPRRLRLAVRLRRQPRGRGPGRRRRGRQGRRLPGDRRRGRLRGQVRRRRPLHPHPARRDRRRPSRSPSPASPTSTTTRPSPTRSSSGPAAPPTTSRRCTGRRSAPRSAPSTSTPISTTASGATRSTRSARPTKRPATARCSCFRRFAASYGGLPPSWWDWQETSGRSGGRSAPTSAARPVTGYRRSSTTRC